MDTYRSRPWLGWYRPGTGPDLVPEAPDALALWHRQAEHAGQRPCTHYFGVTSTVAEVDADSDALAVAMSERGLAPGDRIALYLQNVPQFMVALLATWKLGCIAVPVNPMLKQRELGYVLADSGARGLICLQELWNAAAAKAAEDSPVSVAITTSPLDQVPAGGVAALRSAQRVDTPGAEDFGDLVRRYAGQRPVPATLTPHSVALLTYTSGTTGDPKGAMNTHGNVVFNAQVCRDWIGLTREDICLAGAPLFHITGLIGHIAVSMLTAMPMVLGYRFDPATMCELAERHDATFTILAITAYTAIMNDQSARARDLSSLSKVYSCGSPIPASTVERFAAEIGPYIHNIYGLTETTGPTHAVPYGRPAPVDPATGALSVGVPVFNNVARILDENGEEVPPGTAGEIAVSGPGVVPGYWNRPEVTAQAMPGGEMRTGDIGFMDAQGWFYLIDRKKDLINASGYKVWPREVEDVLVSHPAVREAIVVGARDAYRGETVKAYVSLRHGATVMPQELTVFCKEHLAAYKYPRIIEIMDELPRTATGKLLRRELRDRD
jgi:long-chain acyl-CoA synthetase